MKRSLKLWQWIVVVAMTASVPLAIISVFLIHHSINQSIAFGEQEVRGDAFQRPLEQLLDLLPRYQAAARQALAREEAGKQSLAEIQTELDQAFDVLSANYNGKLGQALKFTDAELAARKRDDARLSVVQAQWQQLKSSPPTVAAAGETVGRLVAATRTMITHAGDLSNLILDSDLDSYYLMDITLCALPQTQQRLSDITLQVGGWLRRDQVVSNQTQIAIMAAMLQQDDQDRITGDAQTSLSEDQNFYGVSETLQKNLPAAMAKYTAANQIFIGLLNRLMAGEKVPVADFETAGWNARAESFSFGAVGADELDHLLAVRVASFRHQQWLSLEIMGAVLALVAVVVWLTVKKLNAVILALSRNLNGASTHVEASAAQVSAASQSLAEGASEQASSLEETSSSLEEMSSMTKRNAENARQANDLAKEARDAADKGVGDMQAMSTAMEAIKVSSDDIAKIIKTIDEIAFQTNILALNAAVEAARAGEAGMGFAVVADEVRNLAQRSAQAAKETAGKIEGAIVKTGQGVDISSKVAAALNEIVTKVRQVDELVTEVAGASREQTEGIAQINVAVGQMDKMTQSNAATAEESAAAAEELNSQAEIMQQSVAELLQLVGDQRETPARKPAAHARHARPVHAATPAAKRFTPHTTSNGNGHASVAPELPTTAKRRGEIPMEGDFKDF